jgi:probable rRNA maturation factor
LKEGWRAVQLLISNEQEEAEFAEELSLLVQSAIEETLASEPSGDIRQAICDREAEVSITLVDDSRMAALNEQYRGIAGTTDVLSFSMLDDEDDAWEIEEEQAPTVVDPVSDPDSQMEMLLGDIVISVPKARDQAASYGNTFTQEMVFLAVHGMLHLLGYDDETDDDAARMMERTRQVMDKLGLGAGRDA